jgi:ABC-type Fe3+ transport system permease subunit
MFEVRSLAGRIGLQLLITLLVIPFLLPLIAMVQGSLGGAGWANYAAVLNVGGIWNFFLSSAIIAGGVIVIVYAVTMLTAYGFSKFRIPGKEIYFWLLLA